MGVSLTIAAGPRQRSHSRIRVPCDSLPYFTVSDLRLPFLSRPTTRRATVDVFDPASTRETNAQLLLAPRYIASGMTSQKTRPLPSSVCPLLLRIRWNVFILQRPFYQESVSSENCLSIYGFIRHNVKKNNSIIKSLYAVWLDSNSESVSATNLCQLACRIAAKASGRYVYSFVVKSWIHRATDRTRLMYWTD
jgi:hypothetical protein